MTRVPLTDGGSDPDRSSRSRRLVYDVGDGERPSEAVVRAVARLTGTSPSELEPLYDAVDPDHLNGLFESASGGASRMELSFDYDGCAVTVLYDRVRVRTPRDER